MNTIQSFVSILMLTNLRSLKVDMPSDKFLMDLYAKNKLFHYSLTNYVTINRQKP